MSRIHIGTSGYAYAHWRRIFYPDLLRSSDWLRYYARVFTTVELNTTFYRLPTEKAVDGWRDATPKSFLFAVKGSRFLTHLKRLTEVGQGVETFFQRVNRLGVKLGPVLWQLPPQMTRVDLPRLENFIAHLPKRPRHVLEFRAEGWYRDEVCALLDRHGVAFCEHDHLARRPPFFTGGFRYLRFHGRTGRYEGRYGRRALAPHAESLVEWTEGGRHAFVYFNNDLQGHALRDALDLSALVSQQDKAEPAARLA